MPRPSFASATRSAVLATLLVAALPSCVPLAPPPVTTSPQPTLATIEYRHVVGFPADRAELSRAQAGALRAFLARLPPEHGVSARVVSHAGGRSATVLDDQLSARRAATVADELRRSGLAEVEVAPSVAALARGYPGGGGGREHSVEVLVRGEEVVLPGCPDWSREPGFDPLNLPLSNLGCANARNLGLMIADPADLVPRRALAPADGTREAEAVLRYRTDKVRQLEAEIIQ